MDNKDIVDETIDKIQAALDEYDGLRESRKETVYQGIMNPLDESPEEGELDWLRVGTTTVTHESPSNKEFLIKDNMMDKQAQPVSVELNNIFKEEINRFEESINMHNTIG